VFVSVFVSQFNFYVEREAFPMDKVSRVALPKSICTSRVLRTCYMLHPKYLFLYHSQNNFEQCKSWTISSCKLHPSSVTSSLFVIIIIIIITYSTRIFTPSL